jgi:DNA-binding LacI/PurR family transcriptional regulator
VAKSKISIEDVAHRARVSVTTVSRVINNFPTVSAQNRSRVEEAISFLKFKPNISAQRLAKGVNNSIGLVMPGYPGIFHSYYAIELIRGIGHACEMLHLDLLFHITSSYNPLNVHNVGGIIFADIIENRKQVEYAVKHGVPCVIVNNKADEIDVSYVAVDNYQGGEMVADYLTSFGHRKIATITGSLSTQSGLQRFEGLKHFLDKKHMPIPAEYIQEGDFSRRSARIAVEKIMALKEPPTAIFAASDDMALEVVAYLLEKGINVPEDISVIGFDDNPSTLFGPVALTTVRQPIFKMAEESVKLLNELTSGKRTENKKIILPLELVVRESCAQPKK